MNRYYDFVNQQKNLNSVFTGEEWHPNSKWIVRIEKAFPERVLESILLISLSRKSFGYKF
jgi:hypothetical protein